MIKISKVAVRNYIQAVTINIITTNPFMSAPIVTNSVATFCFFYSINPRRCGVREHVIQLTTYL